MGRVKSSPLGCAATRPAGDEVEIELAAAMIS
jgi:hypothetical protein